MTWPPLQDTLYLHKFIRKAYQPVPLDVCMCVNLTQVRLETARAVVHLCSIWRAVSLPDEKIHEIHVSKNFI